MHKVTLVVFRFTGFVSRPAKTNGATHQNVHLSPFRLANWGPPMEKKRQMYYMDLSTFRFPVCICTKFTHIYVNRLLATMAGRETV